MLKTGVEMLNLAHEGELIFTFFNEAELGNSLIFADFDAVYRDGIAGDELASFTLARGKTGFSENIDEVFAGSGSREALREQIDIFRGEIGNFTFAKEECSEFLGLFGGFFAVDDLSYLIAEAFLTEASGWIFVVFSENLFKFFRHNEGEVLKVIFEGVIGLVEPELVEVENAGFLWVEPDGVAFGFAEFAAGNLIDDKRAGVAVGFVVFEALDEMDARGAVAKLIGAAELKINVVRAEKV